MSTIQNRLVLLDGCPPGEVAAVLAPTLPYLQPEEREPVASYLLATGGIAAQLAVLNHLAVLGEAGKAALRLTTASLRPVLTHLIERQPFGEESQRIALEAIAAAGHVELMEQLALLMIDRFDRRRAASVAAMQQAAATLREMIERMFGLQDNSREHVPNARDLHIADITVARCARAWPEHRADDVLIAAAFLLGRGVKGTSSAVEKWARERDHAAAFALRRVVASAQHPAIQQNLIRWLSVPYLRSAALRGIAAMLRSPSADVMLRQGHLLRTQGRRVALRQVAQTGRTAPDARVIAPLSRQAQRALPDILEHLDLATRARVDRLSDCILLSDAAARSRALAALESARSERASEATASFAFDPDAGVAVAAYLRLCNEAQPDQNVIEALTRSPLEIIRALATQRAASADVDAFMRLWAQIPQPQRCAAARCVLARDRAGLTQQLKAVIAATLPAQRVELISLIRRIGLAPDLEPELRLQSASSHPRVASAAVAALAECASATAASALRTALRHSDQRVQANAVEAIASTRRSSTLQNDLPLIEPFLHARGARARANAIVALLREGDHVPPGHSPSPGSKHDPIESLRSMIMHRDPEQQISGLWAAQRSRCNAVAREVSLLAERHTTASVREKATAAEMCLNGDVTSGGRALSIGPDRGPRVTLVNI
ncbi:MAG: hypothetical protein ACR2GY_01420 [Phycisphaerales bacterium]